MKNGLYKASFKTPIGQGTGVVVIADGSIKGGDSSMYYIGTFQENNNQVIATIRVSKHSDVPGIIPIFGTNDVNVKLQGKSTDNSATIQGVAAEAPGVQFQAELTLIAA
jgi:hypothetical protein